MARDDFTKPTIDRLAKRVGMRCSNPDCRAPTSGPDAGEGVTNTGVAAHVSAASPGGARYDPSLTPVARRDGANGIWLCQVHAKLIDDDELSYPPSLLREWKETAEHMAALEVRGYAVRRASPFPDLEKKAPKLLAEMRADLRTAPLVRQFTLKSKRTTYSGGHTPLFEYHYDEHDFLRAVVTIMENVGAVRDTTFNAVPRFNFTEEFVAYLLGEV
jgi:hypothetical protein